MPALDRGGVCVASGMVLLAGEGTKGALQMHLGRVRLAFSLPRRHSCSCPSSDLLDADLKVRNNLL